MSLVLGGGVSVRIQGHGVFSKKPRASAKCCITLLHLFKFRHCNEWDLNGNSRSRKNYLLFTTLMIGKGRTLIFIHHQKKNIQNRRLGWFCRLDDSPTRLLIHFFGRSIYKLAKWTLKSNGHKSTGAIIISCRQHSWIGEGAHGNALHLMLPVLAAKDPLFWVLTMELRSVRCRASKWKGLEVDKNAIPGLHKFLLIISLAVTGYWGPGSWASPSDV